MLDANATSGLPVSFSTSDPTRAVVNGGQVQIFGPGEVTFTAIQPGDARFEPGLAPMKSFLLPSGWKPLFGLRSGLRLWLDANGVNGDNVRDDQYDFILETRLVCGPTSRATRTTPFRRWTPT